MIGLDLGSKFIKACTAFEKPDGSYLVYAAMISAPDSYDKKENHIIVKNKVKHLLRQIRFKNKDTVLSVSGLDMLARDFTLPRISDDNIEDAVMIEAENSIFETIDDMYSDYQVLPSSNSDKMDILFVASPKKHINQMIDSLSLTDLSVVGVNADNIALANAFRVFNSKVYDESVVLVNIGHDVSNIAIMGQGDLRFIRNVAFGGKDITNEIAEMYDIDFDTAELIKRQPDVWESIGINMKNILKKSSGNLMEAIFRSMEYCVSRQKIGKIDEILITGGGALLQGIDTFIWETLGINTARWNPLESDNIKSAVNLHYGFFSTVALGLALSKENGNV